MLKKIVGAAVHRGSLSRMHIIDGSHASFQSVTIPKQQNAFQVQKDVC